MRTKIIVVCRRVYLMVLHTYVSTQCGGWTALRSGWLLRRWIWMMGHWGCRWWSRFLVQHHGSHGNDDDDTKNPLALQRQAVKKEKIHKFNREHKCNTCFENGLLLNFQLSKQRQGNKNSRAFLVVDCKWNVSSANQMCSTCSLRHGNMERGAQK